MRPSSWKVLAVIFLVIPAISGFVQTNSRLVPKLRQSRSLSCDLGKGGQAVCKKPPLALSMQAEKGKGGVLDAAVRYYVLI